jgi:prepilin-type N-terminal cleavage/methylation domain-containing protein
LARVAKEKGDECRFPRSVRLFRPINLSQRRASPGARAFTLVEVVFAMAIVGFLIIALYGTITSSVTIIRSCQENEQVTQILSDKLDTIRIYNWDQITAPGTFIPTNFVLGVDPLDATSRPYYTGTISFVRAPVSEMYRSNLMQVTVTVNWLTGGTRPQSRSMTTYVTKYGLQSYIMRDI